jgi:hypothetical protein
MTIFTQHPHDQGVSYFEHRGFAMGIRWPLLRSVMAFAIHALLPCIKIDKHLDFEATSTYLLQRNSFIEATAAGGRWVRDDYCRYMDRPEYPPVE